MRSAIDSELSSDLRAAASMSNSACFCTKLREAGGARAYSANVLPAKSTSASRVPALARYLQSSTRQWRA
jgi:hypothetical protein